MALFPRNKDMLQIFKFHVNTHLNLNKVTNIFSVHINLFFQRKRKKQKEKNLKYFNYLEY